MLHFFRKIRRDLLANGKFFRYLKYGIGEIILVVIGILIALQVDTWNEERKQRETEIHYLKNLKTDLQLNIDELQQYIEWRDSERESALKVVKHFNGQPLTDLNEYSFHITNVYAWQRFILQDNTFRELINSGNLALISNDSIKNGLLDLQTLYVKLKNVEYDVRHEFEVMLYDPSYDILDIENLNKSNAYYRGWQSEFEHVDPLRDNFEIMFEDLKQKNGFVMAAFRFDNMNWWLNEMKAECIAIIRTIDRELESENQ